VDKLLFLCAAFLAFGAPCCAEDKSKAGRNALAPPDASAVPPALRESPPELQKLRRVLAALPARTQVGIANGDPAEFLADLRAALDADAEDLLRLADKRHALPDGYAAEDLVPLAANSAYAVSRNGLRLRRPAEAALRKLAEAALRDGVALAASSAYRSYEYQEEVYARNVRQSGQESADRESARPGQSQHQLGTAVDFGSISDDFAGTKAGRWLAAHAGEYGWSLSFPDGYEDATGYRGECWHYRYIGVEAARFQQKWFSGIQQFMLEFIREWKTQS
jgi:D-alanyl-D-alanine carboxypeptidase